MGVRRLDAASFAELTRERSRPDSLAAERATVAEICRRVRTEGDAALRELGAKFDGWAPGPGESFDVAETDWVGAWDRLDPKDIAALGMAAKRITEFHERQVPTPGDMGGPLRLLTRPVRRAGLYVPGGRVPYPSTVLMTAIAARVAGVTEIVLATPPRPDGTVPDAILAAALIAGGISRVVRVGGAQAIAALAYGTESIPRVDVVAGPGNLYVTLAKREVFGAVGVDGIAGPTEVVVLADDGARPDYIAADLAAQLEHDPMAWGVLVTNSAQLADRVGEELDNLVRGLERAGIIREAKCYLVVTRDLDEAVAAVDDFAPEHLLVVTRDPGSVAARIENAGAIFVGPYSTVPLGDYTAGPNHTLPTAGAARFASPLGVHTFLKRTSVLTLDRDDLETLRDATVRLAHLEGLGAHAHAVEVRLE
ncbi:MAG TPA: histidinol dehydrogenase [Candidatus Dormibacteraeota bacterium]|nr:histidinol dehydrogenase [Candidatus Dormibacteraeota bacterium]